MSVKITQLTALSLVNGSVVVPVVDMSGTPVSKKTTVSAIASYVLTGNAATATLATNATNATNSTTSTNLGSGLAGSVPFQTAPGTTSFTAVGTTGQLLTSAGSGTPTWEDPFNPASPGAIGGNSPASGTFTQLNIPTTTSTASITLVNDVTGWKYSGKSKSVSTEESGPAGVFFKPDGAKMYVTGTTGDDINEYTLSTPWDVSTATYTSVSTTITQDTAPNDLAFSPDGVTLFVLGDTNNTVYQYTLSTPWDILTATFASKTYVVTQETTLTGMFVKPDGTTMFLSGQLSDGVYQYTLSTPWDISTAAYTNKSYIFATQEGSVGNTVFSNDGLTMYVLGASGDDIWQFSLTTPWDVSVVTPVNNLYIGWLETSPSSMFIDTSSPNRVYIIGSGVDTVFQFDTQSTAIRATTDRMIVTGEGYVDGNLTAGTNLYVDGNVVVQGTLTTGSTVAANGLTSSGTTTLASSTATQTVSLGTGVTVSGSTKTVNIGTAGASGSTTSIFIGSSTTGAISNTTVNGLLVNSITAAMTAAGTTQATATIMTTSVANVTTVAAGADGVRLPTAVAGMRVIVRNSDSADSLKLYPATGAQINSLGANLPYTLAASVALELLATTTTQWYTI